MCCTIENGRACLLPSPIISPPHGDLLYVYVHLCDVFQGDHLDVNWASNMIHHERLAMDMSDLGIMATTGMPTSPSYGSGARGTLGLDDDDEDEDEDGHGGAGYDYHGQGDSRAWDSSNKPGLAYRVA